jgi:hypothetical protein
MKAHVIVCLIFASSQILAQGNDNSFRGPVNLHENGVVDGVIIKEELPLRSKIEYEHVRSADYVWSKRVFSRIDAREKINHVIFYPYDYFPYEWNPPSKVEDIDKKDWLKHQERWSLWTIIFRHIMLGDLTVYNVSNKDFSAIEDGYTFKYPIDKNSRDSYFSDAAYKKEINRKISYGGKGPVWKIDRPNTGDTWPITRDAISESFDDWFKRLTTVGDSTAKDPEDYEPLAREPKDELRDAYNSAQAKQSLFKKDVVHFISSQSITGYNIKEDWFFDKERSIIDRRIIAIAPIGRLKPEEENKDDEISDEGIDRFKNFVGVDRNGQFEVKGDDGFEKYEGNVMEKELFWLYFPELRDVIVNYYVYNEQSDAQWMSFDDVFWKRKFSSTIFKVSDKFDRELEDYKYGVDALYEAEKIKDDMRKWEHDVWNY